jgi:hypothetical protein
MESSLKSSIFRDNFVLLKQEHMQTVLQQSYARPYTQTASKPSIWTRFITWCKNQEESRFLWLGISLAGHACLMTPLTLFIIMLTGNSMLFWGFAIAAMGMALITNLAALPTKITIPTFFLSVILDVAIIIASLSTWL